MTRVFSDEPRRILPRRGGKTGIFSRVDATVKCLKIEAAGKGLNTCAIGKLA